CLIVAPQWGYDEPAILSYAISSFCPTSADGLHPRAALCHKPRQSPAPGFGEKYSSLSGFPSHSLESGGGAFLTVIFGQIFAYSAFSDSHFSSPDSVSGLIASTGHSGSQTPQSMHSSGWMTSMFSPS